MERQYLVIYDRMVAFLRPTSSSSVELPETFPCLTAKVRSALALNASNDTFAKVAPPDLRSTINHARCRQQRLGEP
jgi:hypothetical protein